MLGERREVGVERIGGGGFYFKCDGKPLKSSEQGNATIWFIFSKSHSGWGMKNWPQECKSWRKETSWETTAIVQEMMTATEVTAGEVVINGTIWDMINVKLKGLAGGLVMIFRLLACVPVQLAVPVIELGRKCGSNRLGRKIKGINLDMLSMRHPLDTPEKVLSVQQDRQKKNCTQGKY